MLRQWAEGLREGPEGPEGQAPRGGEHAPPLAEPLTQAPVRAPGATPLTEPGSASDSREPRGAPAVLWLVDTPPADADATSRRIPRAGAEVLRADLPAEAPFGKTTALVWGARTPEGGRVVQVRHAPAGTRVLLLVGGVPQVADAVDGKGRCELEVPEGIAEDAAICVQLSRKRTRREVTPRFPDAREARP